MPPDEILEDELMKKRLLCLFLCLVMGLTMVMASCKKEEEDATADVDEDIGAQTITMRLVSEKKVCNTDAELAAYLEKECGCKIKYVSVGAERDAYIEMY